MSGVNAETVAWITGAGTAAGALIGVTAGGVVNVALDRGRERRRARTGARLVRRDLSVAASRIKAVEEEGLWWDFYDLPMVAWDRYEDALSARLKQDEFVPVTEAIVGLTEISDKIRVLREREREVDTTFKQGAEVGAAVARALVRRLGRPGDVPQQPGLPLVIENASEWKTLRESATNAYNSLTRLSGETRLTGLLHD